MEKLTQNELLIEELNICRKALDNSFKLNANLQAKNKQLTAALERALEYIREAKILIIKDIKGAKVLGAKEFADLLKNDWIRNHYYSEDLDVPDWIDNLLKDKEKEE